MFHGVLDELGVAQWQVVHEAGVLRILLVAAGSFVDQDAVRQSVAAAVRAAGVPEVGVRVEMVDSIPRTALGKTPLVRRATA